MPATPWVVLAATALTAVAQQNAKCAYMPAGVQRLVSSVTMHDASGMLYVATTSDTGRRVSLAAINVTAAVSGLGVQWTVKEPPASPRANPQPLMSPPFNSTAPIRQHLVTSANGSDIYMLVWPRAIDACPPSAVPGAAELVRFDGVELEYRADGALMPANGADAVRAMATIPATDWLLLAVDDGVDQRVDVWALDSRQGAPPFGLAVRADLSWRPRPGAVPVAFIPDVDTGDVAVVTEFVTGAAPVQLELHILNTRQFRAIAPSASPNATLTANASVNLTQLLPYPSSSWRASAVAARNGSFAVACTDTRTLATTTVLVRTRHDNSAVSVDIAFNVTIGPAGGLPGYPDNRVSLAYDAGSGQELLFSSWATSGEAQMSAYTSNSSLTPICYGPAGNADCRFRNGTHVAAIFTAAMSADAGSGAKAIVLAVVSGATQLVPGADLAAPYTLPYVHVYSRPDNDTICATAAGHSDLLMGSIVGGGSFADASMTTDGQSIVALGRNRRMYRATFESNAAALAPVCEAGPLAPTDPYAIDDVALLQNASVVSVFTCKDVAAVGDASAAAFVAPDWGVGGQGYTTLVTAVAPLTAVPNATVEPFSAGHSQMMAHFDAPNSIWFVIPVSGMGNIVPLHQMLLDATTGALSRGAWLSKPHTIPM